MIPRRDLPVGLALILGLAAFAAPLGEAGGWTAQAASAVLWLVALAFGVWLLVAPPPTLGASLAATAATVLGAAVTLRLIAAGAHGPDAPAIWLIVLALGFLSWRAMERMAAFGLAAKSRPADFAVPAMFGVWLLYLWQVIVTGFQVPPVLLPSPAAIGHALAGAQGQLAEDFFQTFVKSVIPGFVLGCGSGFAIALVADRIPFLQRGLLPVGNLISALPIVGIAPIMVMWFGFDWPSKAAVVVVMTFFPMLVNTLAGLAATSMIERDLMRTYAASYGQTLVMVRLHAALPFIFNALKINSTLALIGAIVAEFFGTPILGMGFRISTEVGRMNIAMVWATIAVAAVAGSAFYGLLALLERRFTFWHPSYRR